ncbi:MAG TPA: putative ABC transporter permease [Candidatus Blautia intestinigallinarum]|nr:putative ABC transporter permease [Candidatus Blautia intestinigallinarum]
MDFEYNLTQWLLFFYIYSFFGWCIESSYVSIQKKKFVNRGFMRGPFLPLYGSGAVLLLFVTIPVRDSLILSFIFGAAAATVLEYITGACMEALFKVRYWDYSNNPFNLHGYVCLGTSLAWGFLTIVMLRIVHEPVEHLVLSINQTVQDILTAVLTVYVTADMALSFRAALDIRAMLEKMTRVKEEMERMQGRLDAMIAFAGPKMAEKKEEIQNLPYVGEMLQGIKTRLEILQTREREDSGPRKNLEQFRDEIDQIRRKYIVIRERRSLLRERLGYYRRSMLKSHPSITSKKFASALSELKEIAQEKGEKKKK